MKFINWLRISIKKIIFTFAKKISIIIKFEIDSFWNLQFTYIKFKNLAPSTFNCLIIHTCILF